MKALILILTILTTLSPSQLFAGFPGSGMDTGWTPPSGGAMTGDSLDVLLYVKSHTIEPHSASLPVQVKLPASSSSSNIIGFYDKAGTLQSGISKDSELFINTIEAKDPDTPITLQLPSGSTSDDVLSVDCDGYSVHVEHTTGGIRFQKDDMTGAVFGLASSGGFGVFNFAATAYGSISASTAKMRAYEPLGDSHPLKFGIRNNTADIEFWNTTAKVASIDSAGTFETSGNITNDGSGVHYIGHDGSALNRFTAGYFGRVDCETSVITPYIVAQATNGDFALRQNGTGGIVLHEDPDGTDRIRVSVSEPMGPSSKAIELVFSGPTNTGMFRYTDMGVAGVFAFDSSAFFLGDVIHAGNIANDGSGTHNIGSPGDPFDNIYANNATLYYQVGTALIKALPANDLRLQARDGGGIVLMEDSAGVDRLRTSQSGSGADIDVALEFTGGTNSGVFALNDGLNGFTINRKLVNTSQSWVSGGYFGTSSSNPSNHPKGLVSTVGYYGDTTSDPALMPKGVKFGTIASPNDVAYKDGIFYDGTEYFYFKKPDGTRGGVSCNNFIANDFAYTPLVKTLAIVDLAEAGPPSATYYLLDGTANDDTITTDTTLTNAMSSIIVDATSNTVDLTLPASPVAGQIYSIVCKNSDNTITILRNGKTIMWAATDKTITVGKTLDFLWRSTENTWTVKSY